MLLVIPHSRTAGRNARVGRDTGHLGYHHGGAAHGASRQMHQMKVIGHAILRHVGSHGRADHPILQCDAAHRDRREHRWKRMVHAAASGKPFFHPLHIAGIAQLQVGMAHALTARKQAISELLRLLMDVTLHFLKPFHTVARRTLQFERFNLPFFLVALQRALHVAAAALRARATMQWHLPSPAWFPSRY